MFEIFHCALGVFKNEGDDAILAIKHINNQLGCNHPAQMVVTGKVLRAEIIYLEYVFIVS